MERVIAFPALLALRVRARFNNRFLPVIDNPFGSGAMWFVASEPRSVSSTRFGDQVGARLLPLAFTMKKTIRNHDLSRALIAIPAVGGFPAWNPWVHFGAGPFATDRLGIRPPGILRAMRVVPVNSSLHLRVRPPANSAVRMPPGTCSGVLRSRTPWCFFGPVLNATVSRSNRPAGRFRDVS